MNGYPPQRPQYPPGFGPAFGPPQHGVPVRPGAAFPVYPAHYGPGPRPAHTVVRSPEPIAPRGGGDAMPVTDVDRPLSGAYPTNLGTNGVLVTPGADVPYDANGEKLGPSIALLTSPEVQSCAVGESLILTLGLKPRPFVRENVVVMVMPRATVRYGEGAVQAEFQCDFMNGTQIAVGAQKLSVTAQVKIATPLFQLDEFVDVPTFDVKAMVSYGSLNQNSHGARLTDFAWIADPEGTFTLPIPAFAAAFTVIPFDGVDWTASLSGYSSSSDLILPYAGGGAPLDPTMYNVENSFPIPNGMTELTLSTSVDSFSALVLWDLVF